jgi:hypothetical protein
VELDMSEGEPEDDDEEDEEEDDKIAEDQEEEDGWHATKVICPRCGWHFQEVGFRWHDYCKWCSDA